MNAKTPNSGSTVEETVKETFGEALKSYEKALKTGIQLQEESVKLWKDVVSQVGSPQEFQKKLETMADSVFPLARKQMEEFFETFVKSSNQSAELFTKALSVYQTASITESQNRMQDLVKSSLGAFRKNVDSVMATNMKLINSWTDAVEKVAVK